MAPVLTAIIIAGRSGAAFAANIGTMKIRQEIDILSVLNFNTAAFLVLPRVLAVAVATPLLIMLADASGIFGGMITSKVVLDIPMPSYIAQVHSTLEAKTIYSCLIRGAAFGIIIGLTGCFQGLRTENSADSVGVRATRATVSSIILVILADTIFAVLFNSFGW
jgi:phospholipid/cholesterol/gamma-HCH transport system permease protein